MNKASLKLFAIIFVGVFYMSGLAWGQLLLSDSFHVGEDNYSEGLLGDNNDPGQDPQTMTPGDGDVFTAYDGAWYAAAWGAQFGEPVVVNAGLSYPGLLSDGGAIQLHRTSSSGDAPSAQVADIDLNTSELEMGEGDNIYFSYLLHLGGANFAFAGLHFGNPNGDMNYILWGVERDGEDTAFAKIDRSGTERVSEDSFDISDPVLIVGRIRHESGYRFEIDLFFNPDLSEPQPESPTVNGLWAGVWPHQLPGVIDGLRFRAHLVGQTDATLFDEFRIGESWDSVTPSPIPLSGTIFLIGQHQYHQ